MTRSTQISAILGVSGLLTSWFGFIYDLGHLQVVLPFYVVFPLTAALAFGLRGALIAAGSGFFLYPFLFMPEFLPLSVKILHSLGLILWLVLHGYAVDFRKKREQIPWNPVLVQLVYIPVQALLFLGVPSSIASIHLASVTLTLLLMTALANAIFATPLLRKILYDEPFSSRLSYHLNLVMLGTLIIGCCMIALITLVHHFYTGEPFSWDKFLSRRDALAFEATVAFCLVLAGGGFAVRRLEQSMRRETLFQIADSKYKILFNGISSGVVFHAEDGRVVEANLAAPRILGITMDQLLGKTALDPRWRSIHPDGSPLPGEEHPAEIVLRTGKSVFGKPMGIYNPSTEKYTWIETDSWPIYIENSEIRAVAIFRDVTRLYETQKALAQSESNYRRAFDKSSLAFALHEIITDECDQPIDYRYLAVNQAFEQMTGLNGKDLIGKTIREIFPQIEDVWIQTYGKVALSGESVQFEDRTGLTNRVYRVSAYQPAPRQFAVLFFDVTPFHEARSAVEQAQKILEQKNADLESLLHMLSHDLRAPLVNLEGYNAELSELLKTWMRDSSNPYLLREIELAQGFLHSATDRMGAIIAGALKLSRLSRTPLTTSTVNIDQIVVECLKTLNFQIQEKQAQISARSLPPCLGDSGLLGQIFINLLDNAMKYHGDHPPRVEIDGSRESTWSIYRIRDYGPGIPDNYYHHLFKPFRRLNTNTNIQGEGLGLALVKRMVELMHGRIEARAPADRLGGIEFVLYLPHP